MVLIPIGCCLLAAALFSGFFCYINTRDHGDNSEISYPSSFWGE